MTRHIRQTHILIVIASLLLLLGGGLLSGCGAPRHTLLIVMLDETASFAATGQYQAALTWHNKAAKRGQKSDARDGAVIKAVKLLKSGDRYCCIGIDDQVDDSDVRLNLGEIKPHLSARKLFPRQLAILADFTNPANTGIRRTSSGGDLRGAFALAARLARDATQTGHYTVRVLVCADFSTVPGDDWRPSETFPTGTVFSAFYVPRNDDTEPQFTARLNAWRLALERVNLHPTSDDFMPAYASSADGPVRYFMGLERGRPARVAPTADDLAVAPREVAPPPVAPAPREAVSTAVATTTPPTPRGTADPHYVLLSQLPNLDVKNATVDDAIHRLMTGGYTPKAGFRIAGRVRVQAADITPGHVSGVETEQLDAQTHRIKLCVSVRDLPNVTQYTREKAVAAITAAGYTLDTQMPREPSSAVAAGLAIKAATLDEASTLVRLTLSSGAPPKSKPPTVKPKPTAKPTPKPAPTKPSQADIDRANLERARRLATE